MRLTTFNDLIDHTISFMGKDAGTNAAIDAKEAVQSAYAQLALYHPWNYYRRVYRMATNPPYSTGTVVYDHIGGAYPRLLTLTSGTWPEWAASGAVQINGVVYEADERISGTQLTLDRSSNPGDDVASVGYRLFRDSYPLPADFLAVVELSFSDSLAGPGFITPQEFVRLRGRLNSSAGRPQAYAVLGSTDFFGSMQMSFYQAPDQNYNADLIYKSRGRDLIIDAHTEGLVSVSIGSDILTGVSTEFSDEMVGSIVRVGRDSEPIVTGNERLNRYLLERTVLEVISETSIRMDSASTFDRTEVAYIISDPVDVEPNAMMVALKSECRRQARLKNRTKRVEGGEDIESWRTDLQLAIAADSRYIGLRQASAPSLHYRRLQDRGVTDYQ